MTVPETKNRLSKILPNILLGLISLFVSLGICEVALRYYGHAPGYVPQYTNKEFHPVEKLEVSKNFLSDAEGVFKANPAGDWKPPININSDGFRSIEFDNSEW